MEPTIFVGSSTEALPLAEGVRRALDHVARVTVWNQGIFQLSDTVLDSLLTRTRVHDYAVFVLAPDDLILHRDREFDAARDNVIFELGMFTSTMGKKRCFFLVPAAGDEFRLPTDLAGIKFAQYDLDRHDGNHTDAMATACSEIVDAIRNPHPLSGEWDLFIHGSDDGQRNGVMRITCAGDRAVGRLVLNGAREDDEPDRQFRYEGRFVAGQFVLSFEQNDAEEQIVGCMVLRATANRRELIGVTAFWHHDQAAMATSNFTLRRAG